MNRTAFGNQHLGNHTKTITKISLPTLVLSTVIPFFITYLYLHNEYRSYNVASCIFAVSAIFIMISYPSVLLMFYRSLTEMTLNPPPPPSKTPTPPRFTPVRENGKLTQIIVTTDGGDTTLYLQGNDVHADYRGKL